MRKIYMLLLVLISIKATAQFTEKIETDRPDQTETPYAVPKKMFQAEFGFNIEKFTSENINIVHPTSLLKYGLSNRFELRLESTFVTEQLHYIPQTKTNTLLQPVELGTKVRLFEEKGLLPKTSLIAHVGMPFLASKQFHNQPVSFIARLAMQNTISEVVALGYNLGVEREGDDATAFFYTIAPGFSIGEKCYAYVEAFGSFAEAESEHNLDAGIAYCITNNTKLDLSTGFGLGNAPLKNYVALGFSFRLFPKNAKNK